MYGVPDKICGDGIGREATLIKIADNECAPQYLKEQECQYGKQCPPARALPFTLCP